MRVNREDFLNNLEAVAAGTSTREVYEQSSCFCFRGGEVMAFNGEVFCRAPSGLGDDVTGAVRASSLLNFLRKVPDESLEVSHDGTELLLAGKAKEAALVSEADIGKHFDSIERPADWSPLHADFLDAVKFVQSCAGKDVNKFYLTCVHVHPKYVEANDNQHMARFRLKTGFPERCLIPRESIKHAVTIGATKFALSQSWAHFGTEDGLVLSCVKHGDVEHFNTAAMTELFASSGRPVTVPRGLAEATETASVFSSENADDDAVLVTLSQGRLEVKGQGITGWYKERKKVAYSGDTLSFTISPELLVRISKEYREAEVADRFLKVSGGRWTYLSCLGRAE